MNANFVSIHSLSVQTALRNFAAQRSNSVHRRPWSERSAWPADALQKICQPTYPARRPKGKTAFPGTLSSSLCYKKLSVKWQLTGRVQLNLLTLRSSVMFPVSCFRCVSVFKTSLCTVCNDVAENRTKIIFLEEEEKKHWTSQMAAFSSMWLVTLEV